MKTRSLELLRAIIISCSFLPDSLRPVDLPATRPDLAAGPGEGPEVPHLDHGAGKVGEEGGGVEAVSLHLRVRGAVVEELLVRVQEPFLAHQVLEIVVVEHVPSDGVEGGEVVVPAGGRAAPAKGRCESRVDIGLVVDSGSEGGAPRSPDCVGTCKFNPWL